MSLKIKHKLEITFGLILVMFFINLSISYFMIENNKKSIIQVRDSYYKQVKIAAEINFNVIQVQQFLSDASATKNMGSFDDAKQYRDDFKKSMEELKKINPNIKDSIDKISSDFDKFYDLGVNMANVYIKDGYEKGNVIMEQFDPQAVKLSEEINALNEKSDKDMSSELQKITSVLRNNQIVSFVLGAVSLIFVVFIVIILSKNITEPIGNMLLMLKELEVGEGDLTKRINIKSKDEIGNMGQSFNNFIIKLEKMIENIKQNAGKVSKASETLSESNMKTEAGAIEINEKVNNVNDSIHNISGFIGEVTETIEGMAKASYSTAEGTQEILNMSEHINKTAVDSEKEALKAKLEMENIEKISSQAVELNHKLGDKANEIGQIIDTIKGIMEQTNLLALNASIEAARAGESGRGFSVVAEEIKKLAESNTQSADMISELVGGIQSMIRDTISSNIEIGEKIKTEGTMVEGVYGKLQNIIVEVKNINTRIESIAADSEEQSASTEELSATMDSINKSNLEVAAAVTKIADNIDSQTDDMSQARVMSSELKDSSEELDILVRRFKTE